LIAQDEETGNGDEVILPTYWQHLVTHFGDKKGLGMNNRDKLIYTFRER
jgi:hypothetical protein